MNETEVSGRDEASAPLLYGQGQAAWLAVVTVIAVLALVMGFVAIVAAGDDGGSAAGGGGPSDTVSVLATEFAFDPADVTIPAATEVPVTLDNAGAVVHNWTVLSEEIGSEAEFSEDLVLAQVPDTEGGASTEEAITIDEAGDYQVICTIPGHLDGGMAGTVTVQ